MEKGLALLAQDDPKKAARAFARAEGSEHQNLYSALSHLAEAYWQYEKSLPNQTIAGHRAYAAIGKAIAVVDKDPLSDQDVETALQLVQVAMSSEPREQPPDLLRAVHCHLRLLSRDSAEAAPKPLADGQSARSHPTAIGPGMEGPRKIFSPSPTYTDPARRAKIRGGVIFQGVVATNGCVVDVTILNGLPLGLDESVEEGVYWWVFEPATLKDEPVPVYYNATVTFHISD